MKILTATIFSMAVLLSMPAIVSAQVFNGDLTLTTQAEVDAFNYTEVTGSLTIGYEIGDPPSDIKSLKPLSKLTKVGTSLTVVYTILEDLQGLENLTSIGDTLSIVANTKLSSLQGLNNITEIGGGLRLTFNINLPSLQGLENLITVKGHLLINNCNSLTSLEGLENLSSVKDFTIFQNDQLQNLNGLKNLSSVIELSISMNDQLQNLNGLENLTTIDEILFVGFNSSLISLKGVKNIKSLGSLGIWSNDALDNLLGLENLSTIEQDLQIRGNDLLASLQGLENLQSLGSISMARNPILNDCCAIADLIAKVEGEIEISQNGPNCNSEDIIEESCLLPIISGFTLVNTSTDQDIAELVMEDGLAVINTLETGTWFNIRANTSPEMVGCVVFILDGNITRTENAAPYALFGDHPAGNYLYQKLAPGRHTLTAIPYEGKNASGKQGQPLSIELFITDQSLAITSFTLVSTVDNTDQFELTEGAVISLESGNRLNIRANTFGEVKSVVFDFLETNNFRTENVPPFSLGGDHPVGEYFTMPELKTPGVYKLTATPYSLANGQGTAGMPLSITFTVSGPSTADDHGLDFIETKAKKSSEKLNLMEIRLFPNPSKGVLQVQVMDQDQYPISFQLYNPWGVKMWEGRGEVNHTVHMDVSHLSAGLYFLKTIGNGYSHTQRIFVE